MNSEDRGGTSMAGFTPALMAFDRAPGKFSLLRREPAVLFQGSREILQVAAGRARPADAASEIDDDALVRAACRFVKAAFLREGADHYTLLGLDPSVDAQVIKIHYRLMMRLIHPDFTSVGATTGWPKDAATRVNLAYEVLSSPLQRRDYDEGLTERNDTAAGLGAAAGSARPDARPAGGPTPGFGAISERTAARAEKARRKLRMAIALMGVVAAVSMAVFALVFDRGPQVDLVQRRAPNQTDISEGLVSEGSRLGEKAVLEAPLLGRASTTDLEADRPVGSVRTEKVATTEIVALKSNSSSLAKPKSATASKVASHPAANVSEADAPDGGVDTRSVKAATEGGASASASRPKNLGATPAASSAPPSSPRESAVLENTKPKPRGEPASAPIDEGGGQEADPTSNYGAVTMAEAQPLLSVLLHELESGRSNNLLRVLDREARSDPSAYAFASYYEGFVSGARSVRITHIDLKPESRQDKLLMRGFVRIELGDGKGFQTKRLSMTAEFSFRSGAVALTKLTGRESADR